MSISTGEKKLVKKNTEQIAGWQFDHDGNLRLAERTNKAGETEILRVEPHDFKLIYSCSVLESCNIADFDAENKQLYLITNKGDVDLTEIELLDPASGTTKKYESDPESRVDVQGIETSDVDYHVFFTRYEDDRSRLYFKDKNFEGEYKWLQSKLPGKEIGFGSRSKDENIWIVSATSDTEPGETYLWNRKAKTLDLQYRIREEIPRESLSERKPYQFKSSDGLEIHAYLTLPKGLPAKGLPLVVFPHGGPWGRDYWGYDTFSQFFSNRGYAVLQPNFRASTRDTRKKFLNAGNGEWGPQNAGRPDVGREGADRGRDRGLQARGNCGRIVWRICNALPA